MNATINLIKRYASTSLFTKLNLVLFLMFSVYWFKVPQMSIFASSYMVFYFCLMPFLEDDQSKASEQMICMPLKRSQIVLSKYLCNTAVLIFLTIMSILSVYFNYGFSSNIGLLLLIVNICLPIILLSILTPLGLKIGMQWLRTFILGTIFILGFGGSFLFSSIIDGKIILNFTLNLPVTLLAAVVISVLLYMLSLQISIIIFNKREYR
ncbi:MAG: ABC-2 transporter permease [Sarcina sp.]